MNKMKNESDFDPSGDPMEMMVKMMTQQARMQDDLY